jgi:hypothetical protein
MAALWASGRSWGDEGDGSWPVPAANVRAANPVCGVPAPSHAHTHQLPAPKELSSAVQAHVEAPQLVLPVSKRLRPTHVRECVAPLPARAAAPGCFSGLSGGAAWLRYDGGV